MADFVLELADGLQERLAFNVSDRTADFNNGNMRFIRGKVAVETVFNLICNMRDDLDCAAAEISAAFFLQDGPVDFPSGDIGILGQAFVDEAFVVAQIQICFGAVVGDKDFTVLDRVHCPRVNIDIWIKFLHGDFVSARF